MNIATSELRGLPLHWAVAEALGITLGWDGAVLMNGLTPWDPVAAVTRRDSADPFAVEQSLRNVVALALGDAVDVPDFVVQAGGNAVDVAAEEEDDVQPFPDSVEHYGLIDERAGQSLPPAQAELAHEGRMRLVVVDDLLKAWYAVGADFAGLEWAKLMEAVEAAALARARNGEGATDALQLTARSKLLDLMKSIKRLGFANGKQRMVLYREIENQLYVELTALRGVNATMVGFVDPCPAPHFAERQVGILNQPMPKGTPLYAFN